MAKKMIRKLVMIFALLLMVGSQVSADPSCEQNCVDWASTCMNNVVYEYFCCVHYGPGDPYCWYEVYEPNANNCMSSFDMCMSFCN